MSAFDRFRERVLRGVFQLMKRWQVVQALRQGRQTFALRTVWKEHGFDPSSVLGSLPLFPNLGLLKEAPVLDEQNYAKRFSIQERLRSGVEVASYILSSGFSGGRKYTALRTGEEPRFVRMFNTFLRNFYGLRQDQDTLAVMTYFLGAHGGGINISRILYNLSSSRRFRMAVITPGLDINKTVEMLADLGGNYDTWLLFGYPTAVGVLAQELKQRKIPIPQTVYLFIGTEGHTIPWLRSVAKVFNIDLEKGTFGSSTVVSTYGAVELTTISGIQDMEALQISMWAYEDRGLAADLFPSNDPFADLGDPLLFKAPPSIFIENGEGIHEGELLFTGAGSAPIVRLTIGDIGYLVSRSKVLRTLVNHGYDLGQTLRNRGFSSPLPMDFLFLWGRRDSVSVWGITVALRAVRDSLDEPEIVDLHTGYIKITPARFAGSKTRVRITLAPGVGKEVFSRIRKVFYKGLRTRVSEVNSLCNEVGEERLDEAFELVLYEYADPEGPYQESLGREMKLKWID